MAQANLRIMSRRAGYKRITFGVELLSGDVPSEAELFIACGIKRRPFGGLVDYFDADGIELTSNNRANSRFFNVIVYTD